MLEIKERQSTYCLETRETAHGVCAIRVYNNCNWAKEFKIDKIINYLKKTGNKEFSAVEIAPILGMSYRHCLRFLKEAMDNNFLKKIGATNGARYAILLSCFRK